MQDLICNKDNGVIYNLDNYQYDLYSYEQTHIQADIYFIYMGSSSVLVLVRGNQRSKLKSLTAYPN